MRPREIVIRNQLSGMPDGERAKPESVFQTYYQREGCEAVECLSPQLIGTTVNRNVKPKAT